VLAIAAVALVATAAAVLAGLGALDSRNVGNERAQAERFLKGLTLGAGLLFTLVVALSMVPVFLLKACPR
jgi:hypothetical protein